MQGQPPAQAVEVGPINLSEWAEEINNALANNKPCMLASADGKGHPDIAYKGSMMVFDDQHLAWWERSRAEQILQVEENPNVVMFYRNTDTRLQLRIYGAAEIHHDGPVREQVMGKTVQRELDQDPERKGFGVVVRVDRVRLGRNVVQERK